MPASAPLVSITVSRKDSLVVTFERDGEASLIVATNLSPENLEPFRTRFYKEMDEFLEMMNIGLDVGDFYRISQAMDHLHEAGRKLNFRLFGKRRYEVEGYFQRAWLGWQSLTSDAYIPPLVQVTARMDDMLPFEFLPLFDTTFPPPISNKDDLLRVAARFLGFSTIVQRVPAPPPGEAPAPSMSGGVLENTPKLAIRFFQHAGLTGAKWEREFFEQTEWVDLRGPWPAQLLSQGDFIVQLAAKVWEASPDLPAGADQPIDQIQHFACHCNTDKPDSSDYSLELLNHKRFRFASSVRSITIDNFEGEFGALPQRDSTTAYPLIFLNACGASKLTPKGVTSFPKLFLEIGNRGVIGTEASVPDIVAAAFSKRFYSTLIKGQSIGESIYFARRDLLKFNNNPLGILYTVYADPDVCVRQPMT